MLISGTSSVCLLANYEKTEFFYSLACELERQGVRCIWVCVSRKWRAWLRRQGVCNSRILLLDTRRWQAGSRDAALPLSAPSLLQIARMDRHLRAYSPHRSTGILMSFHLELCRWYKNHNVSYVFGEQTWAYEIVAALTARAANIAFCRPHTVRIPNGRFGFFGPLDERLLCVPAAERRPELLGNAEQIAMSIRAGAKPRYMKFNQFGRGPKLSRAWRVISHLWLATVDRGDYTRYGLLRVVRWKIAIAYMRWRSRFAIFDYLVEVPDESFVLCTLHKQPEHSIDVVGAEFSNQLQVIRALASTLPRGTILCVKEHPSAIGDRSVGWYRAAKLIPGVRLLSPGIDTRTLIEKSKLVVSVSGTACLEAGLLGCRAICLSPMYFSSILQRDSFDPFYESIADVLSEPLRVTPERISGYLAALEASTCVGVISDPVSDPTVLDPANIKTVVGAILGLCR